ncbi:MmgE/PrpD family protein [Niveispirillum cyanobacteriorum]|uniref:2-methylcitrate dehydratase n=1 Tax=Niveispirillum cyanobacteriorum TaxID=1612173 RepID=A0A2K9NDG0_9PROT|nr:MmgE/PrpD family protein [Niveispirillum cyanobacteriorum]AUN31181.1 2-methylcitrate dehydratase [Niveispirillum cyanobacteriorum]GGE86673.1 MmgE/PrpD family protein [Niveispirillum cyanobacteriorum]
MNTASEILVRHALSVEWDALPDAAQVAARTFLLDTLGVGIAGAQAAFADTVAAAARGWAGNGPAPILGRAMTVSGPQAAFINAYQIHAQEFDCVHEGAVVHPLATILSALMADTARLPGQVKGTDFGAALVAGVDIAATLGLAAKTPLKFFRPATAGIFGCVAALSRLRRLEPPVAISAFGHALAFASGTMQAHVEGKPGLPLQIAHAAQASLMALDLAVAGLPGTDGSIDGPFGYLTLFETASDLQPLLARLGRDWRIAEVSHKPFPTGRAAHGAIVATQALMRDHGVTPANLDRLTYTAPPLIHRLVGRPLPEYPAAMTANYARLCFAWLGAVVLTRGTVGLSDFAEGRLTDPSLHALGARIRVVADANPDPAAFTPAMAEALLTDGRLVQVRVDSQLGSPGSPLSREQHLRKFRACLDFAGSSPLADPLIKAIDDLHEQQDMAALLRRAAGLAG